MRLATRPPLHRFAQIDSAVRAGGYPSAVTLGRQMEVSSRTVRRDVDFLRDRLHAPLAFCRRRKGYYYTDPTWQLPYFQLTEGEMVALFVAERALRQYRGTPYEADLTRAFQKIADSLTDPVSLDLSALLEQTHSFHTTAAAPHDLEIFKQLASAVRRHRRLRLTYWTASRDAVTEREVDPYHLANIDGDWFLIGFCHLREEVRMFAPARIRRLRETGTDFDPPADFSIARFLDGTFRVVRESGTTAHHVHLRFSPHAARWVREKVWHATQQLTETPAGLELTMAVSSLIEVRRWVMSFGADCEVLAPAELGQAVRDEAARLARLYEVPRVAPAKPPAPSTRTRSGRRRETG